MPATRITSMDFARGVCIFLVILLHAIPTLSMFAEQEPDHWIWVFNFFFQPYRMTLLMFLSGMLLHRSLDKSLWPFIEGKFSSIYIPFLIWSVIVLATENRLTSVNMIKMPFFSLTLLWYLWFLFAYYLLALVLHRLKINIPLVIVASFIAAPILPEFLHMWRFPYLFGFFLMGHYLAARTNLFPRAWWIGAGLLVVAAAGGVMSVSDIHINYDSRYVVFPIACVLFMLWAMPFYRTSGPTRPLEWIGRNSMVFYVVHYPVQVLLARFVFPIDGWSYLAMYAVAVTTPLLIATLLQWGRTRADWIRLLFDFRAVRKLRRPRVQSPLAK